MLTGNIVHDGLVERQECHSVLNHVLQTCKNRDEWYAPLLTPRDAPPPKAMS